MLTLSFSLAGNPTKDVVIKAQVLSKSRRLGTFKSGFKGGVHIATKPDQAKELAAAMLGEELVTKHAPTGIICNKALLVERVYMRREMYLSIVMDRASQSPLLIACPKGGTSIDEIADTSPEIIFTQPIDIEDGLQTRHCYRIATCLGIEKDSVAHANAVELMQNMYKMFIACDCNRIEVNPVAETPDGDILVCDARTNFDDSAEFRQAEIFALRDTSQEDVREVMANEYNLNYVGLDGNIGVMVNGGGLAMATMDLLQTKGGGAANFLDVGGGGTNEKQVLKAFEILNSDRRVKAILVNIFGGIMRCDVIASGIISAVRDIGINKPIVARLQGSNMEEAKLLIEASGYKLMLVDNLDDAASKAVAVADIATKAEKIQLELKFEGFNEL